MSDLAVLLLAFLWFAMLVAVALCAYSYGWWWRGRHEASVKAELEQRIRREYERTE